MDASRLQRPSDVVVIGAGIIGASIAWRLAQAGLRVTVLDAGAVGGEASWAGAGMLAPGGEIDRASESAEFAMESLGLYRSFVEELRAESGAEIDYRESGAIDVAFTADEWTKLRTRAEAQRRIGIHSEDLNQAQVRELAPMVEGEIAGALLFPGDAIVNPRNVTYALHMACERRGVEFHEHRPATAIRVRNGAVEIDTGPGILTAAAAVISAGAWSSQIPVWQGGECLPMAPAFPVKGHLLGYRLPAGSLQPIVRHRKAYILQRANGFTVTGSSEQRVGFDRGVDQNIVAEIHRRACLVLPCLEMAPRSEPWVGFRPTIESLEPEIRRLEGTRVWLSYGHYRNGIMLAPATANRLSRDVISS